MVGWHHQLDGHEFEQTLGVGDGQGGLVCCSSWGHKESDTTERLNWISTSPLEGREVEEGKEPGFNTYHGSQHCIPLPLSLLSNDILSPLYRWGSLDTSLSSAIRIQLRRPWADFGAEPSHSFRAETQALGILLSFTTCFTQSDWSTDGD